MGLSILEIYFEKGFPELGKIKELFLENTGLKLQLYIDINLVNITHDKRQIVKMLENDIGEIEKIDLNFTGSYEKENEATYKKSRNRLNHLNGYSFYASGFTPIHFFLVSNKLSVYDNGSYYFLISLINIFLSSGGKILNQYGKSAPSEYDKRFSIKKKSLKKWNDYKWYNRPRK